MANIRINDDTKSDLDKYFGTEFNMTYNDKIQHLLVLLATSKSTIDITDSLYTTEEFQEKFRLIEATIHYLKGYVRKHGVFKWVDTEVRYIESTQMWRVSGKGRF